MNDEIFPDEPLPTRTEAEGLTVDLPEGDGRLVTGAVEGKRYEILELLGRGGMGEVWRAFDLKLRVEVALKALRGDLFRSESRLELLRQEVRAAREVISPNVCRVFDLIEIDGRELVSMEFVDGATLLGVLKERGPLELKEAQDIASQFLSGLEAIHNAGLVHRDVKPENIMLTRAGRVVVMDFGLARQAAEGGGSASGTPAYMAPEHAAGEQVDARADVYSAGVVLAEMICPEGIKSHESRSSVWKGIRSEPAQVPDSPWAQVIERAVARDRVRRQNSAHTLIRELEDVTLRVEGAEDLHPYPGLASFTKDDAEYFFGREAEIEHMWRKLEGPPRMLALVGPSGAGKTSFLRAGLLPTRRAGWSYLISTPSSDPRASLRRALVAALDDDAEAIRELAAGGDDATITAVSRWAKTNDRAVVVVDQLEELFTLNTSDEQRRFAALLGRLTLEADVFVLLSMRDDFLYLCHRHEALQPVLADLTMLGPPEGAALRRALVQPATTCGFRFEDDELVDDMLAEVEGGRGALPMLAFAAARLWEKRDSDSGHLTRQAYKDIGGVGGALARHAEATVDRIGVERIPIIRELFRNLVTAEGTRAVREWEELLSVFDGGGGEGVKPSPAKRPNTTMGTPHRTVGEGLIPSRDAAAEEVLQELIDARLLTSYETREGDEEPTRSVEIIHESLLANWPRLVRWQTQDQEGAQLRDELRQAARAWDEHGRPNDRLWSGTAFREFQLWSERYPGGLTEIEEAFARAMTALSTRRRRRRRLAFAAVLLIAVAVGSVTTTLWRRSVAETRRAEAGKLLALGVAEIDRYPTAALAYARASLGLADTIEARRFAVEVLWRGPVARILPAQRIARQIGLSDNVHFPMIALSGDERWLALDSPSGHVLLFPSTGGQPLQLPARPQDSPRVIGFGPHSDVLVTGGPDQVVRLLSLPDLAEVRRIELGGDTSGGGMRHGKLLTGTRSADGGERPLVRVWPLDADGAGIARIRDWPAPWAFDPTFRWISYGRGKSLYLRPLETSSVSSERLIGELGSELGDVRFISEDQIVTFDSSGEIRLWSLSDSSSRVLQPPDSESRGLAAVDGETGRFAMHRSQGSVDLFDLHGPPDLEPVHLHRPEAHQGLWAAFQPGGDWLAVTNTFDVAFWPLSGPWMRTFRCERDTMMVVVSFSPDGRRLANFFDGGGVGLWPLDPEDQASRTLVPGLGCSQLCFHPDGDELLVGTMGGEAFLVSVGGGAPRRLETGWEGLVQGTGGLAFDTSGRSAAAVPFDMNPSIRDPELRVLRVWDLPSGEATTYSLAHLTDSSWWGFYELRFLPDGSLIAAGPGSDGAVRLVLPSQEDGKVIAQTLHTALDSGLDLSEDGRHALVRGTAELRLIDLLTGSSRRIDTHGSSSWETNVAIDPGGEFIATGDTEGVVRVGPATGEEPHLLLGGHEGVVWSVDISPDGKWIASVGDEGIRLWPTPDLAKPPLHTLPHDELLATLDELTNLRAVRDPESSTGWSLEVGPFRGWETVPTW
jgi:WD40 repeat protein